MIAFWLYKTLALISDHIDFIVGVVILWIIEVLIGHLVIRWYENGKKRDR